MFSLREKSDEQLISAIRGGGREEDQAIVYLLKSVFPKVLHLITQRSGAREDAEDIFHEALGVLLYNVKTGIFKGESALGTYLIAICKGMWYKRFRKYVRDQEYQKTLTVDDRDESTPEFHLMDEEQKVFLERLFDTLKEGCKEVLFRWAIGESMTDIAQALSFKNAQIAMNKKSKCLNELHERIDLDPSVAALARALRPDV